MSHAPAKVTPSRGFTLVELLVALTIMAMIAGLLASSLSFSLKTAETIESNIFDIESFHQAQRAFRRQVQLALPISSNSDEESQSLDFLATDEQLDFIAPLPGLATGGALYRISLRIEDSREIDGRDGRLVMGYSLYLDGAQLKNSELDVREVVLLENFTRASFSYLDVLSPGNEQWMDSWRYSDRLPDLVRLGVDATDLIVAIKAPLPMQLGSI